MEMSKSIVGKHVENLFLENVASKILEFLELTEDQKLECAKRMMFYETLQAYRLKRNWKVPFEKYKKTLEGYDNYQEFIYSLYYEACYAQKKNKEVKMKFEKYLQNLAFDDEAVYSHGSPIIELSWRNLTAKRLGTTSKHQDFAIRVLASEWAFRETK